MRNRIKQSAADLADTTKKSIITGATALYAKLTTYMQTTENTDTTDDTIAESGGKPAKKKKRNITKFKANITPSLTLYDYYREYKKLGDASYVSQAGTYILNTASSFFYSTKKDNSIKKERTDPKFSDLLLPLSEQSRELVDELKALEPEPNEQGEKEALTEELLLQKNLLLEKLDNTEYEKVKLVSEYVAEHALRRTQWFFYLCVAFKNQHVQIEKGKTDLQHGNGSKSLYTNACHSSLFPSLVLTPTDKSCTLKNIEGTLLKNLMNTTVELPRIVNEFDCTIEGTFNPSNCTRHCVYILNKIAANKISITDAMNEFLDAMNQFFYEYEIKYLNNDLNNLPKANKLIWDLQKQGTFLVADSNNKIKSSYINHWLEISRKKLIATSILPERIYDDYSELQEKLLAPFQTPMDIQEMHKETGPAINRP